MLCGGAVSGELSLLNRVTSSSQDGSEANDGRAKRTTGLASELEGELVFLQ